MWQDWILGATQFIFALSLLATILHPTKKPPRITCLITSCTIAVVVVVYASLGLWFSALGAFVLCVEWTIIAYQRLRLDKIEKNR